MKARGRGLSGADRWTLLLFVAGSAYMAWLVLWLPFIGFANSYDFLRQSACVGLWQSIEGVDKTLGNYQFPSRLLLFDGERRPALCMHSVDNLFPWLATLFSEPGSILSFRPVALLKLLVLWAAVAALLSQAGRLRLPLCAVFVLVFVDWAHLAYANTLYLEFSVLLACFVAVAAACCVLAADARPGKPLLAVLMGGLTWLALSKQQYGPLALVLAGLCAGVLWWRWRAVAAALLCVGLALGGVGAFALLNPSSSELMGKIDQVNKTNTYLGAVLPAATDPLAALRQLGLPDTCRAAIGSTWYSAEGSEPCPAVAQVSRARLFGLFVSQPRTLWYPLYRIALDVRPLYPDYLGVVEPDAGPAAANKWALARGVSFTTWLSSLPKGLYLGLLAAGMATGGWAFISLLSSYRRGALMQPEQRARRAFMLLGVGVAWYGLFSSVFGDGYIEMAKHAVVFTLGVGFQALAVVWWAIDRVVVGRGAKECISWDKG